MTDRIEAGSPPAHGGTRLPALGPHGEGWFAIQVMLLALALGAGLTGPAWSGAWRPTGAVIGIGLMTVGAALLLLGSSGLRANLTPFPRPRPGGRLVDAGVYGLIRHPIYAGVSVGTAGWSLVMASPAALGVAALLLAFFDLKARREEAWLVAEYPGYAAYRRRVRKLVPFVY